MKERHTLHKTYADLLTEQADPEFVQLIQDLDSIGNVPYPPMSVNWTNVRALHAEQAGQQTGLKKGAIVPVHALVHSHHPPLRKAILAPLMIGLVLIIAAAFAPLLHSTLNTRQSPPELASSSLFTNIQQSSPIGIAVVTLVNGYADANQIILGYTISPSNTYVVSQHGLITQEGTDLPAQGNNMAEHVKGMLANSLIFDSSAITGHPQWLELRLYMQIAQVTPVETNTQKTPSDATQKLIQNLGTVEFSFNLPFRVGREVDPQERVSSNGQWITLERVVASQFETRIDVQGLEQTKPKVPLEVALLSPGGAPPGFMPAQTGVNSPGISTFIYPYDIFQEQGTWTLTIRRGTNSWTFHFVASVKSQYSK